MVSAEWNREAREWLDATEHETVPPPGFPRDLAWALIGQVSDLLGQLAALRAEAEEAREYCEALLKSVEMKERGALVAERNALRARLERLMQ